MDLDGEILWSSHEGEREEESDMATSDLQSVGLVDSDAAVLE